MITQEVKSACQDMVMNELSTMLEGSLGDILRTPYHNVQSGIQSAVYKVVQQGMLDLLRKDVIGVQLDAHKVKFFEINAADKGVSKRLLASGSYMEPIATF